MQSHVVAERCLVAVQPSFGARDALRLRVWDDWAKNSDAWPASIKQSLDELAELIDRPGLLPQA